MEFDKLTKDNWLVFAITNYVQSSSVTYEEFEEDLNRFKYLKRLFKRYETNGELKKHLIINHMVLLYNSFDEAATPLLFYKIEEKYWPILKCFMILLDKLPNSLNNNINEECLTLLNLN